MYWKNFNSVIISSGLQKNNLKPSESAEEETLIIQPSANLRSSAKFSFNTFHDETYTKLIQDLSRKWKMLLIIFNFGYHFQPLIHVNCCILLLFRIDRYKKTELQNLSSWYGEKKWHLQDKEKIVVQNADFEASKLRHECLVFLMSCMSVMWHTPKM